MSLGIVQLITSAVMVQRRSVVNCLCQLLIAVTISRVDSVPYTAIINADGSALKDGQVNLQDQTSQLQMVQVVFRHGDRTPDHDEMSLYPNNPYINDTFPPFGLKSLTNKGKEKVYQVGLFLRRRYKDFLNRSYIPDEIYVRTTDYDRTKMSALACLAGLYPPTPEEQWHPKIMWQPIPYHTIPFKEDDMMYYYTCDRFNEARKEHRLTPEFKKLEAPHMGIYEKLTKLTGRNITTPEDVFYLDNLLQSEANYNLTIPDWAMQLEKEIKQMTVLEYQLEFATNELSKIGGGTLLNKILQDFHMKINATMTPQKRKMFIYSAHENNVAAILACSKVFEAHQPLYGATAMIELHKMMPSEIYAIRILYAKDIMKPPQVLLVPGCGGEFCEFNKFVELTKDTVTPSHKLVCDSKHG